MKRRSKPDEHAAAPPLPQPTPRQLAEDWLRALTLTVTADRGTTLEQLYQSIAEANQISAVQVELGTPLPPADARALDDAMAWTSRIRSDQAKANMLIDALLIQWLAEATGQDRAAVVQRLALEVEALLPPA
ncbi:hypothetical protein [Catenulispora pinisilvae]|uniref:hypothetical protein n=1 Tax=Catenulispora pinisilvae TaxID=2705253 RepID=UPI00189107EC|nr:hypothetical protein [Catenulispora pinisilvae]